MTEHEWMSRATDLAANIYRRFLTEVIENHVMQKDREGILLREKAKKQIDKGTHIDPRVLRLMTISGKGGYASDPAKQERYNLYHNITLLDHLLSVVRGALMLAALDWMARNPNLDVILVERRLAVIAIIAFLHDIDKDLKLMRNEAIPLDDLEERMNRYGISLFLESFELDISPGQLRYLIEKIEASQAYRHHPEALPQRELENLTRYIRLADQLDGAWTSTDPKTGGLQGVMTCLENDQGALRSDLLKNWKALQLFDPLHPFLLDELQRYLSRLSLHLAGVPPLIEVHQDGHLFMLITKYRYDEIVQKALSSMTEGLPFNLYLNISNRGTPSLYSGQPHYEELIAFMEGLDSNQRSDLFKIKGSLKESVNEELDDLLSVIGLEPRWPEKTTGQLLSIYGSFKDFDIDGLEWLNRATILVLLLNLKVEAQPKDKVLTSVQRESILVKKVNKVRPEWISSVEDDASRRTLTGLWVAAMAEEDDDLVEDIWDGDDGLLKLWLEGTVDQIGFNRFIPGDRAVIISGIRLRLEQLLSGCRVRVTAEEEMGRCLFTDEPVPFNKTISQATGLYGVKISAFSGRDGRPESVLMDRAHTNVGVSSLAEHKLHYQTHTEQGGQNNGVPSLISSPSTSGLFGGLSMNDDHMMGAMSIYDLSRLEVKKGRVFRGMEIHRGRHRIARLERIPEKLADQVITIDLLLNACRRTGRPFHLFRGLPELRREFFYYDAMPLVLAALIGGQGLFLEQIPQAIHRLQMARDLLNTNGLGHDVLKLYAMPHTRFGASCLVWCHLKDNKEAKPDLQRKFEQECFNFLKGKESMSEQDGAFVKLGKAAAGIQKNPGGMASSSDELLVFKICLEAVSTSLKQGQTDATSLVYAVAGELESNLVRRGKGAKKENRNGKKLMEGCEDVGEIFVNEVWIGAFGNKFPSQKSRRVLSSIYRVAFLKAHKDITNR